MLNMVVEEAVGLLTAQMTLMVVLVALPSLVLVVVEVGRRILVVQEQAVLGVPIPQEAVVLGVRMVLGLMEIPMNLVVVMVAVQGYTLRLMMGEQEESQAVEGEVVGITLLAEKAHRAKSGFGRIR